MLAQLIRRPQVVLLERDVRRASRIAQLLSPIAEIDVAYHFEYVGVALEAMPEAILVCSASQARTVRQAFPSAPLISYWTDSEPPEEAMRATRPAALAGAVMRLFRRVST